MKCFPPSRGYCCGWDEQRLLRHLYGVCTLGCGAHQESCTCISQLAHKHSPGVRLIEWWFSYAFWLWCSPRGVLFSVLLTSLKTCTYLHIVHILAHSACTYLAVCLRSHTLLQHLGAWTTQPLGSCSVHVGNARDGAPGLMLTRQVCFCHWVISWAPLPQTG